jgi:hypothetical protein
MSCLLLVSLIASLISSPGHTGEPSNACKDDPKVVEQCRWFAGSMNLTASNGVMLFSRDDETLSYVVMGVEPTPGIDFKPGSTYIGEFEICPYTPVYSERYQHDENWTCIDNTRNIVELPWDAPPERY